MTPTKEHQRLQEQASAPVPPWRKWGTYVSERAWASVREDYSAYGDAWRFLTHDMARSKAFRWGEDGLAGWCDRYQLLVFSLALWNGRDPILKERLFGLDPSEGNHGEDVKEYYFYLDATPTQSYAKFLYKYPQSEFPYSRLIQENRARSSTVAEYELLDTGIFDDNRYFDVFVEYAKADPEDTCIRIEVFNRGPEPAPIHLIPQLWFRNTWGWGEVRKPRPQICGGGQSDGFIGLRASDEDGIALRGLPFEYVLGTRYLYGEPGADLLFTDNETNGPLVFGQNAQSASLFVKDAFHRRIVTGEECTNPDRVGTKACFSYPARLVPAGGSIVLRLRLTNSELSTPLGDVDRVVESRRKEADEFYDSIHPKGISDEEKRVQRQALASLIWSKQLYLYNVHQWLDGDNRNLPPPASRKGIRNVHWRHLNSMRVLTMPDKWEYPWFAAWDLAFQTVPFALVDSGYAKEQLWLMLFEQFQHPNGQIPAYEWDFSDLNPPVHAWAVWRVYNMDRIRSGKADRAFLEKCFHKLLINFAWWVNKVDSQGNNVFEGGFLGLDNIAVLDRSAKQPPGVRLEQSDATGWMGMFCLNLMRIALELARENKAYEALATKFFQHYVYIGAAMKNMGNCGYQLWDEEDGFFYDVLRYADGTYHKLRVRSLVGLIPLFAIERLEEDWIEPFPEFKGNLDWFLKNRRDLVQQCVTTIERDGQKVHVLAVMDPTQIRALIRRICDPQEFRSEYGLRSLSKYHEAHPFRLGENEVRYEPAEAAIKIKGGNSNWRGPIWFPTAFLLIESLRKLEKAYGREFTIETCGKTEDIGTITQSLADSLIKLFLPDEQHQRPIYRGMNKFRDDPHWRDLILFNEYFHGDTGQGLGASHQTGWTALVASLIDEWR